MLTFRESSFFQVLEEVVLPPNRIFPQVRVADVVTLDRHDISAFNKISAKHVDFVIVDEFFRTLCCVELDDRSHDSSKRRDRDRFVDSVFAEAGIPLIRFRHDLRPETVAAALKQYVGVRRD